MRLTCLAVLLPLLLWPNASAASESTTAALPHIGEELCLLADVRGG